MTEAAVAPAVDRLKALEEATKEYAEYSRNSFGLAGIAGGILVAGRIALVPFSERPWDPVANVTTMTVWALALALARRWYQRKGAVIAPGMVGRAGLGVVYLGVVTAILGLVVDGREIDRGGVLLWAYFATILLIPGLLGLAARAMRGYLDSGVFAAMACPPVFLRVVTTAGAGSLNPGQATAMSIFFGLLFGSMILAIVVQGVQQHLAFRRLERRLAGLRSGLASGEVEP